MTSIREGRLLLTKVGPLGPFANNAYVIADGETGDAIIVDAPAEPEKVVAAAAGLTVRRIVVTHRHGDHWQGIDLLRERTNAPVYCHGADRGPYEGKVAGTVADGEEISFGGLRLRVLHTPGHTPGSICLLVAEHLISGDTLFPGGPGRTVRPEDLRREIESITSRLYVLPETVRVYPGHGDDTTIGASKAEYAVFASRQHPADLCGDVTWLGS
jgi:hydroxyacylglutathione hydrolase